MGEHLEPALLPETPPLLAHESNMGGREGERRREKEGKGDSGTSTSFPRARLSWNSSSSSPGVPCSERDFGVCGSAVQMELSILVERATVRCDACHRGSGTRPWGGTVLIWGEQVNVETVGGA